MIDEQLIPIPVDKNEISIILDALELLLAISAKIVTRNDEKNNVTITENTDLQMCKNICALHTKLQRNLLVINQVNKFNEKQGES